MPQKFDSTHQEDDNYEEKALLKCRNLFYWLFLAVKDDNIIEKIPIQICSNQSIANHFKKFKDNHTLKNGSGEDSLNAIYTPLAQLATSTATTQEAISKLVNLQTTSSEKNSKSFKKIPATYKKML